MLYGLASVCHAKSTVDTHTLAARSYMFLFIQFGVRDKTQQKPQYILLLHIHIWPEARTHYNNLMHDGIMFQHLHGRLIAYTYIDNGIRFTLTLFNSGWTFYPSLVSMALDYFIFSFLQYIYRDRYTKIPIRKLLPWQANFVRYSDRFDLNLHQWFFFVSFHKIRHWVCIWKWHSSRKKNTVCCVLTFKNNYHILHKKRVNWLLRSLSLWKEISVLPSHYCCSIQFNLFKWSCYYSKSQNKKLSRSSRALFG